MEKGLEHYRGKLNYYMLELESLSEKLLEIYITKSFKENKRIIEENLNWLKNNNEEVLVVLNESVDYCKGFKELIDENINVTTDYANKIDEKYELFEYKGVYDEIENISNSLINITLLEMNISTITFSYLNLLNKYTEVWEKKVK